MSLKMALFHYFFNDTATTEIYTLSLHDALPISWMDLEIVKLCEFKSDRERQISYDITHMWNLKNWYKQIYLRNRNRVTDVENNFMVTRGEGGKIGRAHV